MDNRRKILSLLEKYVIEAGIHTIAVGIGHYVFIPVK